MGYRYETHCHTSEGSKCGTQSVDELVDFYHRAGYSGICITDHFSGNSSLPDNTPWEERVTHYHNIYLKAREAGERLGLSVFFGIEYSLFEDIDHMSRVTGTDFVILNITKEWLLKNRDAFASGPVGLFGRVRGAGGFVTHAHPFSEAPWIQYIRLIPRGVDAVETINARLTDFMNENAKAYARRYELLETAGSDLHGPNQQVLGGLETPYPCNSVGELIDAIKKREAKPFTMVR